MPVSTSPCPHRVSSAPRWGRRLGPVLLASTLVLAACQKNTPAGGAGGANGAKPAAGNAPEVGYVTVQTSDAPLQIELPGRLSASQTAEVRPQVTGLVLERLYTEGSRVAAGQALYRLDPQSFEVERARSAAALQKAQAQLAAARTKAARDAELLRADTISRQVADDSAAAALQADADVAVARAALDAAQVQLNRTRITAPIGGLIEASAVSAGALVTASQAAPLTTIRRTDPMHVDIVQNSAQLLELRRRLNAGETGGSRRVQLVLEDGSTYPQPAQLQFSSVSVDTGTGAVTLRATVPNPQGTLLPGMVVSARLLAAVDQNVVLVPQQGVTRSPTGEATALVLGADDKVELRHLVLDRAVGNQWLVREGLKPGDRLLTEGLQRVRAGQTVRPVPAGSAPAKGGQAGGNASGKAASSPPAGAASAAPAPSAAAR